MRLTCDITKRGGMISASTIHMIAQTVKHQWKRIVPIDVQKTTRDKQGCFTNCRFGRDPRKGQVDFSTTVSPSDKGDSGSDSF